MPDEAKDGLDTTSDAGTAVLEQPGGESAQIEGTSDATDQTEGKDAGAAANGAAAGGAEDKSKNEDPDADIKAMLREDREARKGKVEPKGGTDAAPKAGADAKDGKPAGDSKAKPETDEPAPFSKRVEDLSKTFNDEFEPETAKAFNSVLTIVKDMEEAHAKEIASLKQAAAGYGQHVQASGQQLYDSTVDRLATKLGFESLVGNASEGDLSADQIKARADILEDAILVFELAKQKGKPISEFRAVKFALTQAKTGGKSPETVAEQEQAKKRQAARSIAPKSGGGGTVKNPSGNKDDPDAEAHAAVESTLRSFGRR